MKIKKDKIEMRCYREGDIEYKYNFYKGEYYLTAPLRIFPSKSVFSREEMQKLINLISTTDFKVTIERVK